MWTRAIFLEDGSVYHRFPSSPVVIVDSHGEVVVGAGNSRITPDDVIRASAARSTTHMFPSGPTVTFEREKLFGANPEKSVTMPAADLLPVEGVDAENIADGEIVVGALHDLNLIAGPHIALDKDAQ
jgi:hypothetical protein